MTARTNAQILIVDDEPVNIRVLSELLQSNGFEVRFATSGEDCVASVAARPPDLVMLDIAMAGMDGFAVCRRLKADPKTREIPVLFLSVLGETTNKVRAFEAGGADHVSKPFQVEEVLARVGYHVRLATLQADLREAHRKLLEADRLKASLTAMIVHDLRSPLTVISATLDALTMGGAKDAADLVNMSQLSVQKMLGIVNDVLDVYRTDHASAEPSLQPIDPTPILEQCGKCAKLEAALKGIAFDVQLEGPLGRIAADAGRLDRALSNVLSNAVKFTPEGGRVRLRAATAPSPPRVVVVVEDSGHGIHPDDLAFVFDPFRQGASPHQSLGFGLGLTVAKRVVESHRGTIAVASRVGEGTVFTIELPSLASIDGG